MNARVLGRHRRPAVILFLFLALSPGGVHPANTLTPDQRAIIATLAKPSDAADVQYAGKSADPFGTEVKLPFQGKYITLVRKQSNFRDDGSITWVGEVAETGERAVLMLWGNALLTGYFAYKGTIFAVESLGGGVEAYRELGRGLPDHPAESGRPDGDPQAIPNATTPDRIPLEPAVSPFPDARRKELEAKTITIDIMLFYTKSVANHYTRDPEDLLALAIDETNETFRNSGLGNIRLRLVHTQLIDYDASSGDQFNHLSPLLDHLPPSNA